MAEASSAWLLVTVKRGASIVVPRKIVKIGWDNVFGELLIQSKPSITVLLWFLSGPLVCYYCGVEEECFVEDDTIQQLRTEYAVDLCAFCARMMERYHLSKCQGILESALGKNDIEQTRNMKLHNFFFYKK